MEPKIATTISLLREGKVVTVDTLLSLGNDITFTKAQEIMKSIILNGGSINPQYQAVFIITLCNNSIVSNQKVLSSSMDEFLKLYRNEIKSVKIYAIANQGVAINDIVLYNSTKQDIERILQSIKFNNIDYSYQQIKSTIHKIKQLQISQPAPQKNIGKAETHKPTEMKKPETHKAEETRKAETHKPQEPSKPDTFLFKPVSQSHIGDFKKTAPKKEIQIQIQDKTKETKPIPEHTNKIEKDNGLVSKPGIQINIEIKGKKKKEAKRKKKYNDTSSEDASLKCDSGEEPPYNPKRKHDNSNEMDSKRIKVLSSSLFVTHDDCEDKQESNEVVQPTTDEVIKEEQPKQYEKVRKTRIITKVVEKVDSKGYTVCEDVKETVEYYEDVEIKPYVETKKGKSKAEKNAVQNTIDSYFMKRI